MHDFQAKLMDFQTKLMELRLNFLENSSLSHGVSSDTPSRPTKDQRKGAAVSHVFAENVDKKRRIIAFCGILV